MNTYYISNNGEKLGPFTPSDLVLNGLTRQSLVWCPGMDTWKAAALVDELKPYLATEYYKPPELPDGHGTTGSQFDYSSTYNSNSSQPPQQPPQQPPGGFVNYGKKAFIEKPSTYMGLNIALIVSLCCLNPISVIIGIIGISKGSSCKAANEAGNVELARIYSREARKYAIWGWVIAIIWFVAFMVYSVVTDDPQEAEKAKTEMSVSSGDASAVSVEPVSDADAEDAPSAPASAAAGKPDAPSTAPATEAPAPAPKPQGKINHRYQ